MAKSNPRCRGDCWRPATTVFIVALGLRLGFAFAFGGHDLAAKFSGNREDPQVYDWCARNLLDSGVIGFRGEPSARRGPAYPSFLAGVYATVGDDPLRVRVVQAVLDSVAAAMIVLAVSMTGAARASFWSGLTYACYPIFVFNASEIMTEGLVLALLCGALTTLMLAWRKASWGWAAASGALCGLAALTRENLAPLAMLWAVALIVLGRMTGAPLQRRIAVGASVVIGFAVAYGPWVIRNSLLFGTFMPAGSSGGENLLRSVGLAQEGSAFNWRACLESNGLLNYWAYHDPSHRGEAFPNEVESDRRATALAQQWIGQHPGRFIGYGFEKVGRLLAQVEERSGTSGGWLRDGMSWSYRLVAIAGVIGGVMAWRRGDWFIVIVLAMLSLLGWAVIFVVVAWKRYRYVSFDFSCVVLAGWALDAAISRFWPARASPRIDENRGSEQEAIHRATPAPGGIDRD